LTIRNLERAVHPKSIAVIGASAREGSVGQVVMNNIIAAGFEGEVCELDPGFGTIG
jgi:acetyltransferase